MIWELCNQDVLRLFGADHVVVELLVDVAGGLCAFRETQKVKLKLAKLMR